MRASPAVQHAIFPAEPWLAPHGKIRFRLAGPAVAPVVWKLNGNRSGASLDANGYYVAGATDGAIDVVTATLADGATFQTYVHVGGDMVVSPDRILVPPGASFAFTVRGGDGHYRWSILANGAQGTIDEGCGLYHAAPPPLRNGIDIIEVSDGAGHSATAQALNGRTHR
jgi:hypothetical protein